MKRKSLIRILFVLFGIILFNVLFLGYSTRTLTNQVADSPNRITISSNIPKDIFSDGTPASKATLRQAAIFAWKEFIALNWPADPDLRGKPKPNLPFGSDDKPLVWETLRNKIEIYPGNSKQANQPFYNGSPSRGGPDYYYDPAKVMTTDGQIYSCNGTAPRRNAFINLDEADEIGLNRMYAGKAPTNYPGQQFLYLAKANEQEYDYVRNLKWNTFDSRVPNKNTSFSQATQNTISKIQKSKEYPIPNPTNPTFISLPYNTIEVKSAWRHLNTDEDTSKFHVAPVRFYKNQSSTKGQGNYCFIQSEKGWGMGALHIIQKTPSAPYFIFATFSQADNITKKDGTSVEDVNGQLKNPSILQSNPFDPKIFSDTPKPRNPDPNAIYETAASGINDSQKFDPLTPPNAPENHLPNDLRLYYENILGASALPQVPISINRRANPIPDQIIAVNQYAHSVISNYIHAHGLSSSPWLNYKLVNIQWVPLTKNANAPGKPYTGSDVANYYLANEVVETDLNLQLFSGQFKNTNENLITDFAYKNQIPGFAFGSKNQYANVVHQGKQFNMGGCMGCHGNATNKGADFSFILLDGPVPFSYPEVGGDALPNQLRFIRQQSKRSR